MACEPFSWLVVLSGLLTPLIAITTAYIAYQQYRLSQLQFRHELYERRLRVYKAVQSFLSELVREGGTEVPRLYQFYSDASEAVFLFDSSVQAYIDEIYRKGVETVCLRERLYFSDGSPNLPIGEERSRVAEADGVLLMWHADQLVASKEFFRSKMGVAQ